MIRLIAADSPPPGVCAGFTSRRGGVAPPPWESLTLAAAEHLPEALLLENWRRALHALSPGARPEHLALMSQVHGAEVALVQAPTGPLTTVGEVDALVTTQRGLVLAVRVADCVPVLMWSRGVVAAVHAGWRSTVGGVVSRTVEAMEELGAGPGEVTAWIGPHISGEAYEVGEEVVLALTSAGVPRTVCASQKNNHWHVDLGAAVAFQLRGAGVTSVQSLGACTTSAEYFSWRGDGPITGRQAGLVMLCP